MLVTNTSEINQWFPNTSFIEDETPNIQPYLNAAERTHLLPILGQPLYRFLLAEYKTDGEYINEHTPDLLERSQAVVILFGIYGAIPALNVTINTSGGLTVGSSSNMTPASKDRSDKLIEATFTYANDAVEQLLLYLEDNSIHFTDETDNELWKQSDRYWWKTGCLIFTAREFNEIVNINNSRILFNRIYPALRLIERTKLRPAFGTLVIAQLITRKMEKKLTETDKDLLEHMQTALALLTIPQSEELSKPDSIHGYKPNECKMLAENEIALAKSILRANPSEYPNYYENVPGYGLVERWKNDSSKPVFVMGGGNRR